MDRSPSKQTNKQRRQNKAIGVVTRLEDSRAEQSWLESRDAQKNYLILKLCIGSGLHPVSSSMGPRVLSPRVKADGA